MALYMGNWGYFTPISGDLFTLLTAGFWAHFAVDHDFRLHYTNCHCLKTFQLLKIKTQQSSGRFYKPLIPLKFNIAHEK